MSTPNGRKPRPRNRPAASRPAVRAAASRIRDQVRKGALSRRSKKARLAFVCGYRKSGTHWVANLINLHPHAHVDGELHLQRLRAILRNLHARPIYRTGGRVRPVIDEAFERLVRESIASLAVRKPGASLLGDHSPEPLIRMLPDDDIKYVVIVRDGRDVLISWTYHWLRSPIECYVPRPLKREYRAARARLDGSAEALRAAARPLLDNDEWVRFGAADWVLRLRADKHFVEKAPPVLASQVLQLRYEKLHTDLESERRRLYEFLELDPSLAAAPSHETKTLPGFKKEDPREFYRKGQVGDWQNYFTRRMAAVFQSEAGPALVRLGYEKDGSWVERLSPEVVVPRREVATR